jgi:hypothetical protein
MPRDPYRRANNYNLKTTPIAYAHAIDTLKPYWVEAELIHFPALYEIEVAVKTICESEGIAPNVIAMYLSFAKSVYNRRRKFSSGTQNAEVRILVTKFTSYGCDPDILNRILTDVFGFPVPPS